VKASNEQLNRILELSRKVSLDGRNLRGHTGCALTDLDRDKAARVIEALIKVDTIPLPKDSAVADARFAAAYRKGLAPQPPADEGGRVLKSLGQPWPPASVQAPTSTNGAVRSPAAGETWDSYIADLLKVPPPPSEPCRHCDGTGRIPQPHSKTELLRLAYQGPRAPSRKVAIQALRLPTFPRLQGLANHFGGDLNAAAAFSQHLADLLEADT